MSEAARWPRRSRQGFSRNALLSPRQWVCLFAVERAARDLEAGVIDAGGLVKEWDKGKIMAAVL